MSNPKPRLLIICPPFFGYDRAIAAAAEGLGYEAVLIDARASDSVAYRIGLKTAPRLTRAMTQKTVAARLACLPHPAGFAHVLIVKGDGLTVPAVQILRRLAPQARMSAYLWDSLDNMPGMAPVLSMVDRVFSFDSGDCAQFGWHWLPLFSRKAQDTGGARPVDPVWDWSFIGSLHSDRHRVLRRLVAENPDLTYFVHCYVQNRLVRLLRAAGDPQVLGNGPPPLSTQVLGYDRYLEVTAKSRAVVDIEHPSQTGLTMRTIETLIAGKKLITTNAAVRDSDLYHPDRVLVIERNQPNIPVGFLSTSFASVPASTAQRYQISNWLQRILD